MKFIKRFENRMWFHQASLRWVIDLAFVEYLGKFYVETNVYVERNIFKTNLPILDSPVYKVWFLL